MPVVPRPNHMSAFIVAAVALFTAPMALNHLSSSAGPARDAASETRFERVQYMEEAAQQVE